MANENIVVSGKRKRSIARAVIGKGKGQIRINKFMLNVFTPEFAREKIKEPISLAGEDITKNLKIEVKVKGGGWQAQAEAARLAIARALVAYTKSKPLEKIFLDYDRNMLVQDSRFAETSKPNDSKPRAKRQKSYR
jgi:small subunit ribosomal protein S9